MNKKANTPITVIFSFLMFLILYVLFLNEFLADAGQGYIAANNPTGVVFFFYNHISSVALFIMIIALVGYTAWVSNG